MNEMPDIKELLTVIVKPLVNQPDQVRIEVVDGDEFLEYHLYVAPEDVGRVIGKNGRVANAIRTIIYSIRVDGGRRVRLVIEDGKDTDDNDGHNETENDQNQTEVGQEEI